MKNIISKKLILLITISIFFLATKTYASIVTLTPSKDTVGIGEQFYVDMMLDPQNVSVNGVEGNVFFSGDNISFVRAENGKSLINLWMEEPKLNGNNISFAGIIPNGFDGVIDPFNPKQKLSGLIVRLIFESKKPGIANIGAFPLSVTLNNGQGSVENTNNVSTSILIQNIENAFVYNDINDVNPELSASIVRDPNLFDNKYVLLFQARDQETGIKDVLIKEGNRDWKKITSPYLLEDQTRHSDIALQANNFLGSSITITINSIPYDFLSKVSVISLIIFVFIILFILFIKKYVNKK